MKNLLTRYRHSTLFKAVVCSFLFLSIVIGLAAWNEANNPAPKVQAMAGVPELPPPPPEEPENTYIDPDSDGDGVLNEEDLCSGTPPLVEVDDDGCENTEIYYIDTDGDGVVDADDVCSRGDDNIDSDGDGTPDACEPVEREPLTEEEIDELFGDDVEPPQSIDLPEEEDGSVYEDE